MKFNDNSQQRAPPPPSSVRKIARCKETDNYLQTNKNNGIFVIARSCDKIINDNIGPTSNISLTDLELYSLRNPKRNGHVRTETQRGEIRFAVDQSVALRRQMAQKKYLCAEQNVYFYIQIRNSLTSYDVKGYRFTEYEIIIQTNSIAFTLSKSLVRRRYSEFVWFRDKLKNDNGVEPPVLPPKSFFNRFNDDFINHRKEFLQEFLERLTEETVFLSDSLLHLFLQSQLAIAEIEKMLTNENKLSISEAIIQDHGLQELCVDIKKCQIISHALHGPTLCCTSSTRLENQILPAINFKKGSLENYLGVRDSSPADESELSLNQTWALVSKQSDVYQSLPLLPDGQLAEVYQSQSRRHTLATPIAADPKKPDRKSARIFRGARYVVRRSRSQPDLSTPSETPSSCFGKAECKDRLGPRRTDRSKNRHSLCEDQMNNMVFEHSVEKFGPSKSESCTKLASNLILL